MGNSNPSSRCPIGRALGDRKCGHQCPAWKHWKGDPNCHCGRPPTAPPPQTPSPSPPPSPPQRPSPRTQLKQNTPNVDLGGAGGGSAISATAAAAAAALSVNTLEGQKHFAEHRKQLNIKNIESFECLTENTPNNERIQQYRKINSNLQALQCQIELYKHYLENTC